MIEEPLPRPRLDDDDDEDESLMPEGFEKLLFVRELIRSRSILVSETITDRLARSVIAQCILLESRDTSKPVTVYINSPGGSADSGFAIYDILRFIKAPVRTVVCGLCASAAVTVFLAGPKGSRLSLPNGRFLLHQPSTMSRGDASDIEITAREIVRLRDRYNAIVAEATTKSLEQVAKDADRDFWLDANEAKEYGLVDRIVEHRGELD